MYFGLEQNTKNEKIHIVQKVQKGVKKGHSNFRLTSDRFKPNNDLKPPMLNTHICIPVIDLSPIII